jgi:hypothetical protein
MLQILANRATIYPARGSARGGGKAYMRGADAIHFIFAGRHGAGGSGPADQHEF